MTIKVGDICLYWDEGEQHYINSSLVICTKQNDCAGKRYCRDQSLPVVLTELLQGRLVNTHYYDEMGKVLTTKGRYVQPRTLEKLINVLDYTEDELWEFKKRVQSMGISLKKCLTNLKI